MHFVASYPKSGNTWIRLTTAAYQLPDADPAELMNYNDQNGEIKRVMRFADNQLYHYRCVSPLPVEDLDLPAQVRLRPAAMFALEREVKLVTAQVPPLVKSHHFHGNVNGIPLWRPQWTDRVVNPVRDPREVCCSYAAHMGMTYEETAEFMASPKAKADVEQFDHVRHFYSSWSNHIRGWMNTEAFPVCTVRYEDLNDRPVDAFYEIFDFLDFPDLSRDRVRRAVEKTQFDKLKNVEEDHGFEEQTEEQDSFFRSGKTDGWKDELPTNVARKIENDHGEMMERLGYL